MTHRVNFNVPVVAQDETDHSSRRRAGYRALLGLG